MQLDIRCAATIPSAVPDQPKEPPVASWLGIGFLLNGSDFTRKAVQKHGHVWKANILGNAIYGLAGDEGLKAFYDEKNIKRFPGMSANLEQAAWVLKDDNYNPHYAIPPLDTDRNWQQRKLHFMAGIDSRAAVQSYLQSLDEGISETIADLGTDGKEFALWDTINSLVLGGLSKAFFGYGLSDYMAGEKAMISSIQTGYTVFDAKMKASPEQKDAFATNVRYLQEALAQYRAKPHKYPGAGLGKYLAGAEKLHYPDEDIIMDMHQMICVGAYGGITSSAGCMAYSLATNPDVVAKAKAEIAKANLGSATPTFATMKDLPYTFAVLKEALRKWPIVHIVRGQSIQDIVVEGKLVPKNSTVIAALHGTMHDPTVYTEPDKFDPERFTERNEGADEIWTGYQVVFGAGDSGSQHACAGRNTALLTLFVLLVRLVQNWQWELVSSSEHLVTNHFSPNPSNDLKMRRRA